MGGVPPAATLANQYAMPLDPQMFASQYQQYAEQQQTPSANIPPAAAANVPTNMNQLSQNLPHFSRIPLQGGPSQGGPSYPPNVTSFCLISTYLVLNFQ